MPRLDRRARRQASTSSQEAMRPQGVGLGRKLRIATSMCRARATPEGMIESGEAVLPLLWPLAASTTPAHAPDLTISIVPASFASFERDPPYGSSTLWHASRIRTGCASPGRDARTAPRDRHPNYGDR